MTTPRPAALWAKATLLAALGLVATSVLTVRLVLWEDAPRGVAGLSVEGIAVEGLRREEMVRALAPTIGEQRSLPITLTFAGNIWRVDPAEAGLVWQLDGTLTEALAVGRRGTLADRLRERWRVRRHGRDIPLVITSDAGKYESFLTALTATTDREAVKAGWKVLADDMVVVTPGATGTRLRPEVLARQLAAAARRVEGRREVALPVHTVHPEITSDEAYSLAISGVVAKYRTTFNPGDQNRAGNVRLAARAIDQKVLMPGVIFSFNRQVGPRIPQSGYREAPVVVNGRLVPGVGGGVCQVSSTLYNAVLLGDLKVVRRSRHSLPSAYVQPGRDATVAYDYLDFKFQNNSGYPLVVDTEVGSNWLEVRLLGRPVPGRQVEIQVVTEKIIPPGVIEKLDKTLPRGRRVPGSRGAPGYQVKVWRIVSQDGSEVRREMLSDDSYLPVDGIVRVGTARSAAGKGRSRSGTQ